MGKPTRPRVGAVSYLNSVPLVYRIAPLRDHYDLVLDYPSRLADQLHRRELAAGLIPAFEAFAGSDYHIVSDACVGCRGPVWSVKLLSRVPVAEVRSVALDEGSRTSVALTKILASRYWKISPEYSRLPLDVDFRTTATDAVLIIGDRAMQDNSDFLEQHDLGQTWREWTGLPFVFAVWAARPEADLAFLDRELTIARDAGLACREQIVAEYHARYGLTPGQCRKYLYENLNYFLGEAEREALRRFAHYAAEAQLLTRPPRLEFYDCEIAR